MGIELGFQPHVIDQMNNLINSYPFDFVIGSVHVVDQMDPYYPDYWKISLRRREYSGALKRLRETVRLSGLNIWSYRLYCSICPATRLNTESTHIPIMLMF